MKNAIKVAFNINKGPKVKIESITFSGNENVKSSKLASSMKKTKDRHWKNFLKSKKFNEKEYENDKKVLIEKYNEIGYRDAVIVSDTVVKRDDGKVDVYLEVDEGKKYYFGDIK